ncbi:MAG TPA: IS1634 family transposase [Ktedonobacteraceae bacterium]
MNEIVQLTIERVDDIPILLAQRERMQVASLLDRYFPTHGNWQGLSLGEVVEVWLSHILSEGDQWLNHVEPWANQHLSCVQACLGQAVRGLDFSDDRLASVLDYLSADEQWQAFERELSRHLIRVYDLRPSRVRVESTTSRGYVQPTPDGLFQFGHSKDHRPDLPQVKIKLSALDPLGLPLGLTVVGGERADDGLYVPAIHQVQQTLGQRGLLYVGDCKMAALPTRAYVQQSGDFYLCPLSGVQVSEATLRRLVAPVQAGTQPLRTIERRGEQDERAEAIAVGYEYTQQVSLTQHEHTVQWGERVLVVRSLKLAQRHQAALHERLAKAQAELAVLNQAERKRGKKVLRQVQEVREVAEAIVRRSRVEGLLEIEYHERMVSERPVRRYGAREAGTRVEREISLHVQVNAAAVTQAESCLGWHVYVTNQPAEQLSLEQAVLAYRGEYVIERGFGRLKGRPLSLRPMQLTSDQRVTGLIRLLSLGLRVLCLLEYQVRCQLAAHREALAGLYAGNPKRTTKRPTSEALLKAFKGLHVTALTQLAQTVSHVTPLSALQERILALLGFPAELYAQLALSSDQLAFKMSEP